MQKTVITILFGVSILSSCLGYFLYFEPQSELVRTRDVKGEATNQIQNAVSLGITDEKPSEIRDAQIAADMTVDDKHQLHVVWKRDNGFFYTSIDTDGIKWKPFVALPLPSMSVLSNGEPRLIFYNKQLHVFYGLHLEHLIGTISKNSEVVWKNATPLLNPNSVAAKFDVSWGTRGIAVATVERSGGIDGNILSVLASAPNGEVFEKTTIFTPQQGDVEYARPSVLVRDDNIHVLWPTVRTWTDGSIQHYSSFLYHFWGTDFGKTWAHEEIDIGGVGRETIITESKLLRSESNLQAFYIANSTLYRQSMNTSRSHWDTPRFLANGNKLNLLTGFSGQKSRIMWVDDRFREKEWWGDTLIEVLSDTSPDWRNNDVLIANPQSNTAEFQILTPSLSYTSGLWVSAVDEDTAYILRTGRTKVGKQLHTFGAKPELYIQKIRITD